VDEGRKKKGRKRRRPGLSKKEASSRNKRLASQGLKSRWLSGDEAAAKFDAARKAARAARRRKKRA
jgi:hypothetical protein